MKRLAVSRFAVLALVVLAFTAPALAGGRKKAAPAPTPHDIVISSISGNTMTVTDEKTAKTVTITQFTEITVNGQRATIADLKPGMTVSLGLAGPTQASRITATAKK